MLINSDPGGLPKMHHLVRWLLRWSFRTQRRVPSYRRFWRSNCRKRETGPHRRQLRASNYSNMSGIRQRLSSMTKRCSKLLSAI